ncbi:S8 family peptidase [Saccharothrix deserti]|uniref:S8 family peptidase n=1 Tax=Saccharothrix deserti TaxID=2593674 RepID=UPI00131E29E6|nr:S8 family serine peptidase [Saccharothrix deserti]
MIPLDALPLLRQDRLDRRLFDVTGLVEQDYDDEHEPVVPTMIGGAAIAAAQAEPLARLGLTKRDIPKTEAASVWRDLTGTSVAATGKVWLNGRVRAALDRSVPQVGAPQAWRAGLRGDGVKVAVLDTGYDAMHPELAGKVDAEANFTDEGEARVDTDGHGTHVASSIAGVGDKHTGVAPGARLLVGKVLGSYGGREDWVLAGMQWAVDNGAKVVNMSLGGGAGDGTDLLSQTVNRLSETTGVLFVVSAGNAGGRSTVGSPGTADRALTVGSVTKSDQLSNFSSRGPRIGDFGLKPEISAPGSDIVAARAAGTLAPFAVDERHARLSGTSMAAPHVAGAAAILAGQHPDWTGEQIKGALVGSAHRLADVDTHAQGAGRLDVARATTQQVRVEGVAGFGEVWGARRADHGITYVNDGDRDVALELTAEVDQPDRIVLDRAVTVPARSRTTVVVGVNGDAGTRGEVTGAVVARGRDIVLTTPLTANLLGDPHELTVDVTGQDGEPVRSVVIVTDERTGRSSDAMVWDGEPARFTVPAGDYRITGITQDSSGATTMFAQPAAVAGATEVVVDAKRGRRIVATIDDPDARAGYGGVTAIVSDPDEDGPIDGSLVAFSGTPDENTDLYTIGSPRMRGLDLVQFSYFTPPHVAVTVVGDGGFEFTSVGTAGPLGFEGVITGRVVDIGLADPETIEKAGDLTGALVLIAPPDWDNEPPLDIDELTRGIELAKDKGAKAVLSYTGLPQPPALPMAALWARDEVQALQALLHRRPVEVSMLSRAGSPDAYFLADRVTGHVPEGHEFRYRRAALGTVDRLLVDTAKPGQYRFHYGFWTFGGLTASAEVETIWPQRRSDHATEGTAISMAAASGFTDTGDFGFETTIPVELKPGERRTSRVFSAPFGPELTTPPVDSQDGKPLPWAYRVRDDVRFAIPMFADSDPGNVAQYDTTNLGTTTLYRGAREVGRSDVPGTGTFTATPGTYRLVVDATRPVAETAMVPALSTRTGAEWTFRIGRGDATRRALPLLDVRFTLPLDDHNRAAAAEALTGTVTAAHQPDAPVVRAKVRTVEVSFDDGRTWQRADLSGDRVTVPAGGVAGGFVSLRATAADMTGNAVTETVIRACSLR